MLLSDKHNHIDFVRLVFIPYYYMFRLSTSAITGSQIEHSPARPCPAGHLTTVSSKV